MGGTVDGLAILPSGEGVLIEVKCPYTRSIGTTVPEHYVGQVQMYLEITGLDRCLFLQYKPAYVTAARKFQRPERLTMTSVVHDPGYLVTRMPILWNFYKRLCAFRAGVLPTADAAARLIQAAWKQMAKRIEEHKQASHPMLSPHLHVILIAVEYRRVRMHYGGVSAVCETEMEFFQKPQMAPRMLSESTQLVVVPNNADVCTLGGQDGPQNIVVCEEALAQKREAPDSVDPVKEPNEKKAKQ